MSHEPTLHRRSSHSNDSVSQRRSSHSNDTVSQRRSSHSNDSVSQRRSGHHSESDTDHQDGSSSVRPNHGKPHAPPCDRRRRVTLAPDWHAMLDHDKHDDDASSLDETTPDSVTTAVVIQRIEALATSLVDCLDQGTLPVLTQWQPRRSTTVATALAAPGMMVKRFTLHQCRCVTSILLVVNYCHALLCSNQASNSTANKTVTTREVYYVYVTHFKSQRECNDAIAHACRWLHVPRHALGLQASARGWVCGDVTLLVPHTSTSTSTIYAQAHPCDSHALGLSIASDWLWHDASSRAFVVHPVTTARCIVLVEKEGLYQRLVQDGLADSCIVVTAKGFPDHATRACVHVLHQTWPHLSILGLADCDPYGLAVLNCYAKGWTGHSSANRAIPVQWMGLRPSQVHYLSQAQTIAWHDDNDEVEYPALPPAVRQALTVRDVRLLRQWLDTPPFSNTVHVQRELQTMMQTKCKVELEALYWLGMEFCALWVERLIDWHLQRPNDTPPVHWKIL